MCGVTLPLFLLSTLLSGSGMEQLLYLQLPFLRVLYLICRVVLEVNYFAADQGDQGKKFDLYRIRDDPLLCVCRIRHNLNKIILSDFYKGLSYNFFS